MSSLKTAFNKLKKQDKELNILNERIEVFWRKYSQATLTETRNRTAQEIQVEFFSLFITEYLHTTLYTT